MLVAAVSGRDRLGQTRGAGLDRAAEQVVDLLVDRHLLFRAALAALRRLPVGALLGGGRDLAASLLLPHGRQIVVEEREQDGPAEERDHFRALVLVLGGVDFDADLHVGFSVLTWVRRLRYTEHARTGQARTERLDT